MWSLPEMIVLSKLVEGQKKVRNNLAIDRASGLCHKRRRHSWAVASITEDDPGVESEKTSYNTLG
jgi:hypothetical protein